ncbi:hypothetical protein [Roseateles puraquae]|uniref:hypothetical protein n=1 Tax=Roseateles puraquae TaxID=431059 RepID=UPI0031D61994
MADSKGGLGSFPWASAAVLLAFVASTQLVPHAFDALRPAEKARAQAPLDPDLEVNARLWEDPFAALRRYEVERSERCDRLRKQASARLDVDCESRVAAARNPLQFAARLDDDHDKALDDTLILLGLMPGADFVGAEEARRRIRYATLAGLLAQGYMPDNAERLSLLEFDLLTPGLVSSTAVTQNPGAARGSYVVPYELLLLREQRGMSASGARPEPNPARYSRIAVLWIDESSLPLRKLDALARLVDRLMGLTALDAAGRRKLDSPSLPQLAVIGPSSTDALRTALRDLRCAAELNNVEGIRRSKRALEDATLCATRDTRVGAGLPPDVLDGYRLLSRAKFYNSASTAPISILAELDAKDQLLGDLGRQSLDRFLSHQFSRLTGDDPVQHPVRMERTVGDDTDLIERLMTELQLRLSRTAGRIVLVAERDSIYAQALVSRITEALPPERARQLQVIYFFRGIDGATTKDGAAVAAPASPKSQPTLEWPESRDQLDYLRRLGAQLKQSEADSRLAPIGAIGILANDVHDKLLVLQALHEDFSDRMFFTTDMDARYLHPRTQAFTRNLVVASSLPLAFYPVPPGQFDLQAGTPPLRDNYQTSTYAAARRAGCRNEACRDAEREALRVPLSQPSVYEIGRSAAVPLAGYALNAAPQGGLAGRVSVALAMAGAVLGGLFVWPGTPALRQAVGALRPGRGRGDRAPLAPTALLLVVLHAALLAFLLVSLVEFIWPGPQAAGRRPCESCEPMVWLEGVSAWPSHLIHLLGLFLILWTLDWAWADAQRRLRQDSRWLQLDAPIVHTQVGQLLRDWWDRGSVLFWRPGVGFSCDFKVLWAEYGERGGPLPRVLRCAFWYGLTVAVVLLIFISVNGLQVPAVPVRGPSHRHLVAAGLYALLFLLPLLIVTVADSITLLYRFVKHLNAGRSYYPEATLQNVARALGPEHAALWAERFAARPQDRGRTAAEGGDDFTVHTLLDDWIDVRVVARRSAPVARLVIWPFVVLALLVVARSRLFDNWALTPAIAVGVSFYVAVLIGLTLLLKQAAENTRRRALASMQADLRWLAGSGKPRADLVEPFKRLIVQVENETEGAFASFFDQPLLKAMLVPLGGAGGTQLFDYLLLGR